MWVSEACVCLNQEPTKLNNKINIQEIFLTGWETIKKEMSFPPFFSGCLLVCTRIQVADVAWNGEAQATAVLCELNAELVVIARAVELEEKDKLRGGFGSPTVTLPWRPCWRHPPCRPSCPGWGRETTGGCRLSGLLQWAAALCCQHCAGPATRNRLLSKVQHERIAVDSTGVVQVAEEEFFKTHFLGRQQLAAHCDSEAAASQTSITLSVSSSFTPRPFITATGNKIFGMHRHIDPEFTVFLKLTVKSLWHLKTFSV